MAKENLKTEAPAKKLMLHWVKVALLVALTDYVSVLVSYFFGLLLRFDFMFSKIPEQYLSRFIRVVPAYGVFLLAVFSVGKLYRSIWRFASFNEMIRLVICNLICGFCFMVGMFLIPGCRLPISVVIIGMILQFLCTTGIRFSYRLLNFLRSRFRPAIKRENEEGYVAGRVMVIGAGAAGQMIARDIVSSKETSDKVVCFIDDNSNKWGRYIDGVQCVGGRNEIFEAVKKYEVDKIVFAIPSIDAKGRREYLNLCKETGCELRSLPGIYQMMSGEVTVSTLRPVAIEDLLGRDTIRVNDDEIFSTIRDKVVLVTGGGGSIGSELCRQIAAHGPKQLIIFDVYENNAYDIQQELIKKYPELNLLVLIGSVRDSRRSFGVFEKYRPEICFHAAAHKHVPLMEVSPCESIKNNAIGTYKTAYAAMACGCKRFVLISTDKAVNPTNIMGASKRLCEMIIQSFDYFIKKGTPEKIPLLASHSEFGTDGEHFPFLVEKPVTEYVAVRFGNVLGSNGSVVPLFKKQIEAGGPVTVTHPDIIRYFMTIPEAVSLVLQAGAYAKGGEIFVLDMGEPVKIDTLARNLIKLSGLKPDVDINIVYTGLRPGEKLYEERLMLEEGMQKTANKLIFIGRPLQFDHNALMENLERLMKAAYENSDSIKQYVKECVTTYEPQEVE